LLKENSDETDLASISREDDVIVEKKLKKIDNITSGLHYNTYYRVTHYLKFEDTGVKQIFCFSKLV
jgi:hypothetical protein